MTKPETHDVVAVLLRGVIALLAARERRDGRTQDDIAATLARSGMPHVEIAAALGTTSSTARKAVHRGRKNRRAAPRTKRGTARR